MAALKGTAQAVAIGEGFEVRAPGLVGEANIAPSIPRSMRAPMAGFDARSRGIEQALAATHLDEVHRVEVKVDARSPAVMPARAPGPRQAAPRAHTFEVTAPAPPPGHGQVVLARDHLGVLTWHLPDHQAKSKKGKQVFVVPAPAMPRRQWATQARPQREGGLVDLVARKVLQFLVYPLVDPVLGAIEEKFAQRWEERNRPYGLRTFTPSNFRDAATGEFVPQDWQRLATGRALLFVHGTFSTAHGAFPGISDDVMRELFDHYEGRVFAFNHFTLSDDPVRNAKWFVEQIPSGVKIEADIVCHSRGGLVARALAERPSPFAIDSSGLAVRRVVFAGVPNAGTALAEADHMVQMIDRLTTAFSLFPEGPVTEVLEALITAVKVLGHAGLKGLPGLAAMDPHGAYLSKLNKPDARFVPAGYAIAADYEPTEPAMRALVADGVDAVMDSVFDDVPNDLVVPQPGVFEKNGGKAFPLPLDRVLQIAPSEGVMHTTLFRHRPAQEKILEWLEGAA